MSMLLESMCIVLKKHIFNSCLRISKIKNKTKIKNEHKFHTVHRSCAPNQYLA